MAGAVTDTSAAPGPHSIRQTRVMDTAEHMRTLDEEGRRPAGAAREAGTDAEVPTCWSFLPAPSPPAFRVRRQAHETTVHRADAESALGGTPDGPAAALAVDGIDELLLAFHARAKSRVRTEKPRVLRVRATDRDVLWTVRLTREPPVTTRTETSTAADTDADTDPHTEADTGPDADCEIADPASQLYLSLWNRLPFPSVTGDPSLAALWQEKSGIVMG